MKKSRKIKKKMLANEEILEERRAAYEEHQRVLLAKLMSEKGGMCMKGATIAENECKAIEFFKQLAILDMKFIDIVREDWGLDPEDPTATFGDDLDKRWDHFIREHIVKDEKGEPTILYKDKDGNYRLIPGKYPKIQDMGFVINNFERILLTDNEKEEVVPIPSVTILGIEGLCGEKYAEYNLEPTDPNFFLTQIMMLAGEMLDLIKENKTELKESGNELFKVLEEKYKDVF